MKRFTIGRLLIVVYMLGVVSCATTPRAINPYFEMPPDRLLKTERELFALALRKQKSNKIDNSIKLWKRFLKYNPRSFRAYNNLGMAYYTNDQLLPAISTFEKGLTLEPFDNKIKKNLKRALQFKVTLLRENKDYDAAIHFSKRILELSKEPEREKVALEIETLEDRIFEQVKQSDNLESYEAFLARYPNSPKNSEEARRQIARMKVQKFPIAELPTMESKSLPSSPNLETESFGIKSMKTPNYSMRDPVISEEVIEIIAEPKLGGTKAEGMQQDSEFPEGELPLDPEGILLDEPPVKEKLLEQSEKTVVAKSIRKVKITTKTTPLQVHSNPSNKSKVLGQLPKNDIVPMFQETRKWYQVEYLPGKKGWISKKYSELAK